MRIFLLLSLLSVWGVTAKIDHKAKHTKEKREPTPAASKEADEVSHKKQFINTLLEKRSGHKAAIQSIIDIDKSKQRVFVEDVLKNIKKLLEEHQDMIVRIGHEANAPFPHDSETLKESLMKVFENLSFFADLTLRFPKMVSKILKKDRKLKSAIIWGYQYTSNSDLLDSETNRVLGGMAQQLEIVERDEGFFNPFDKEDVKQQIDKAAEKEQERKRKDAKPKIKKDAKLKKPEVKKMKKEEL